MDTPSPKPSGTDPRNLLARLWNRLCRRGRPPKPDAPRNRQPIPPICYDME
jgi:hypothetical protein